MLSIIRTRRSRTRESFFPTTFTLNPFRRRYRFRREKHAKPARSTVGIVHPHTYSGEDGSRAQPVIVSTKMEALQSLPPDIVPDYVLTAGLDAARSRRESGNARRARALHRKTSSIIPLMTGTPQSTIDTKSVTMSPTTSCTTLTSTIPDVPPTLNKSFERTTASTPRLRRARKQERCRKPVCRHFVLVWKRVTGLARRIVRVGPDGQRESWLPAGFVVIDSRSSWWKKQSLSSKFKNRN